MTTQPSSNTLHQEPPEERAAREQQNHPGRREVELNFGPFRLEPVYDIYEGDCDVRNVTMPGHEWKDLPTELHYNIEDWFNRQDWKRACRKELGLDNEE